MAATEKVVKTLRKQRSDAADLQGKCFGRLMVSRLYARGRRTFWLCSCSCGNKNFKTQTNNLVSGKTKSCGCLRQEKPKDKPNRLLPYEERKRPNSRGTKNKEYLVFLKKQKKVCAICRKPETTKHSTGKIRSLALDHDPKTGKNRGLLCRRCNTGLGLFFDNKKSLSRAIKYLGG